MPNNTTYQILLAAGDYDIVQSVQRALPSGRFALHFAFTHRDAEYMLKSNIFDALIVDAAMSDRHSGRLAMATISEMIQHTPLIALAKGRSSNNGALVNALDQREIQTTVMRALNISNATPVPSRGVTTNLTQSVESRRVDEINTLFDLSKSLTEVLDLSEVLNRVVEAARDLTNAEEGMILLPEGEELYLRAKVGVDIDTGHNFRVKTNDALIGQVFKTGQPSLIGSESGPQKVKTEYFVKAMLYVPILLQGEIMGVLGVNNKHKTDQFDIHHQELLINLASFAAVAIENARIHEESIERARELETLVKASETINSSLSLRDVLPNICEQFATVVNVGYAEILQWQRVENHLHTMAGSYKANWRLGQGPKIDLTRYPAINMAVEKNRPRWLKEQDRSYHHEVAELTRTGSEATLIIPLFQSGRFMGVVRIFYINAPNPPPNSETIQQVHKLALETLSNVLTQPNRTNSGNMLILSKQVNKLVGADWCELWGHIENTTQLSLISRIGSGVWLDEPYPTIDLGQYPDLVTTLENRKPLFIHADSTELSESSRALITRTHGRSLLGLPLVQRGKTQGVVIFSDSEHERRFTDREVDMARAIVGQAATALENANLLHDLELSLKELKETQNRLVQTARLSAMGELAAVVAHQINNPLTTIIVDTELMLMDESEGSPNYEALMAISRAGKRAANVARRLLAISRPTDPEAPADLIDVVDTVRGVLSLVQTHIERSNIRIETQLPEEAIPGVMAVKGSLDDVWLNIIMNAHDALLGEQTKNGKIDIRVEYKPETEMIEVMVKDNGMGIPQEIIKQIFSPFFTTKPVGEGTGLGLHVCREVVENCGGYITVDSVPNEFTCFVVHLPVASAQ